MLLMEHSEEAKDVDTSTTQIHTTEPQKHHGREGGKTVRAEDQKNCCEIVS